MDFDWCEKNEMSVCVKTLCQSDYNRSTSHNPKVGTRHHTVNRYQPTVLSPFYMALQQSNACASLHHHAHTHPLHTTSPSSAGLHTREVGPIATFEEGGWSISSRSLSWLVQDTHHLLQQPCCIAKLTLIITL